MGEEPGQDKDLGATAPQSLCNALYLALDSIYVTELNGRLCALPESLDEDDGTRESRCCDSCRRIWKRTEEALALYRSTRETAKQSPPKEASRGEEPGRLRAAIDEAQSQVFQAKCMDDSARWAENRMNIKAKHLDALLAEVERLAGERDLYKSWSAEDCKRADHFADECERLAGDLDAALIRGDTWERTYWASEKQAAEEGADRERLIEAAQATVRYFEASIGEPCSPDCEDIDCVPFRLARAALADVGGSE